ncbi:hypothetical protein PCANC_06692 [Puccinia coronata f. sp. avenae]|uniref:Uncharacterized protein n=1 Tax=Puccinia coronata f. sp. avenae TaxID=200324 RepID=A0A2N5VUE6_9BASI|nr:hypothetical protein PCANC_06692 [Puccinia coronata f. sp. avenae]
MSPSHVHPDGRSSIVVSPLFGMQAEADDNYLGYEKFAADDEWFKFGSLFGEPAEVEQQRT